MEECNSELPYGLRVLVVEDDETCLFILEKMLLSWRYQVAKCRLANEALSLLREDKSRYDIVISDLHMPDMDGFKLLEIIGLEMDLPVLMVSSDDKQDVIMKGIIHGACDYLIKPIQRDALRLIWQHVVRKRNIQLKELQQLRIAEDGELQLNHHNAAENAVPVPVLTNEENDRSSKRKNVDEDHHEDETEASDDLNKGKKARLVWTQDLHYTFVVAVNQLGLDRAVPKKILECMQKLGASNLTRENVASHLQKYRSALRKNDQTQSTSHIGYKEPNTVRSYALNEFNLQTSASSGQLPYQSFSAQVAGQERQNSIDHSNNFDSRILGLEYQREKQFSNSAMQGNSHYSMPITVDFNHLVLIQKQQEEAAARSRSFGLQIHGGSSFQNLPSSLGANSTNLVNTTVFRNQSPMLINQIAPRTQMVNGSTSQVMSSGYVVSPQLLPNYIKGQVVDQNMGSTSAMESSNIAPTCYPANGLSKPDFPLQRSTSADCSIYENLGSIGNIPILAEQQEYRNLENSDELYNKLFAENASEFDPRSLPAFMCYENLVHDRQHAGADDFQAQTIQRAS